jgi:hypothetical protein
MDYAKMIFSIFDGNHKMDKMSCTIDETDKTIEWFANHDFQIPDGLSFLPENFDTATNTEDFIFTDTLSEVRKIFKASEIPFELLNVKKPKLRTRKNADWLGPTLFISFSLLFQNSALVSITLNVLSNYLTDFFKGTIGKKNVKFEIVVETKKNVETKRITYEGSIEGIAELYPIIDSFKK